MGKLTPAQSKVIRLLQAGECITCSNTHYYVSDGLKSHRIDWRVWDKLTENYKHVWERQNAFISQQLHYPFNWELTKLGKDYK